MSEGAVLKIHPMQITRVVCAVRYDPQYEVTDRKGAVLDKVLRGKGTPFGPPRFPLTESAATLHRIFHPDTGDAFIVSERDLILDVGVDYRRVEDTAPLTKEFIKFILEPFLAICGQIKINRYGFLTRFDQAQNTIGRPTRTYLSESMKDARSMQMRFTHRVPTVDASVREGVSDYRQVIYTMNEEAEGEVRLALDYQEYFDPPLSKSDQQTKSFDKFIAQAMAYHNSRFADWLKSFERVRRAG